MIRTAISPRLAIRIFRNMLVLSPKINVVFIAMHFLLQTVREALNKSILLMARQAHHERNQMLTVLPSLSKDLISDSLAPF
jgi:hypothetical protein